MCLASVPGLCRIRHLQFKISGFCKHKACRPGDETSTGFGSGTKTRASHTTQEEIFLNFISFLAICESFLHEVWHILVGQQPIVCESFLHENLIFHQSTKIIFSLESFQVYGSHLERCQSSGILLLCVIHKSHLYS